eukprot:CAMPEP_0184645670 /NCGR_PEP_ID=MMETSP0308-20130426/2214_1 /TAXON_ID=38269 /ORGANISM="Gloeochaete witrockiana, Strain SAG 46.84" /LENGTH=247 /DNA_ID=CAMNT_0027074931 /DNA_START=170 /DNA_END=911 /DNA_ORIENTATION=+
MIDNRILCLLFFAFVVALGAKNDPFPSSLDSTTLTLLQVFKTRGSRDAAQFAPFGSSVVVGSADQSELWFDIYVKEGADAQSVREAIEKHGGHVDAFIDCYKGGAFGASLALSAIETVAANEGVLSMNAVMRPQIQQHIPHSERSRRILEKLKTTIQQQTITGTALNDQAYVPMGMAAARQQCPGGNMAGQGITVGILSDSFDYLGGYVSDVTRGKNPSMQGMHAEFRSYTPTPILSQTNIQVMHLW